MTARLEKENERLRAQVAGLARRLATHRTREASLEEEAARLRAEVLRLRRELAAEHGQDPASVT